MTPTRREPAYVRIARELADAIASGAVGVGERLPTELEIAQRQQVSRHTAREALRRIDDLGLVERRQGSGTRVKSKLPPARFNQAVQTIEDLLDYGNASRLQVVRARRARASREVARQLQVAPGAAVVRIDAERYQQAWPEPIALTDAWVVLGPAIDARELLDPRRGVHALLRLVELSRLARVEQSFTAAAAGATAARRLGIATGAPVLIAQRRYFGTDGVLLLLAISTHRADRYAYANVLTRDPGPRG
jgi:DNA-binding GntR family transcriptional regulator